ncbi:MAG: hypothetical protein Q7S73_02530 [bacterium]|nr:hypothetical protein [bacterium]
MNKKTVYSLILLVLLAGLAYFGYFYFFTKNSLQEAEDRGINNLSGEVIKVSDNSIEISAEVPERLDLSGNPSKLAQKIYAVNIPKDFRIDIVLNNNFSNPGILKSAKDIKVGDIVSIVAQENIIGASSVTAKELVILRFN